LNATTSNPARSRPSVSPPHPENKLSAFRYFPAPSFSYFNPGYGLSVPDTNACPPGINLSAMFFINRKILENKYPNIQTS